MGREIRRVIPNWEHPKTQRYDQFTRTYEAAYAPLHNESYISALTEWIAHHALWEVGEHPDQHNANFGDMSEYHHYADWGGDAPRSEYYRPEWGDGEATWWQVYETVSEGTPVTPPFATRQELIEYLVENGDFWDQQRRAEGRCCGFQMPCAPWTREQAEAFVREDGWAPSMVIQGGAVMSGVEALTQQ